MFVISIPQTLFEGEKYFWADDRWVTESKYARPFMCKSEATAYLHKHEVQFSQYAGEVSVDWIDGEFDIVEIVKGLINL